MNRRFIKQVVLFALVYYVAFLALNGIIILLSHIPPQAMNLDPVILKLYAVERILAWPRFLLRWLWPGESTPRYVNVVIAILSCLVWGIILAGLKALWTQARK